MLQNGKSHPKNPSSRAGVKTVKIFLKKIRSFEVVLHWIPDGTIPTTAVEQGFVLVSRRIHSMGSNPVPGRGRAVLVGHDKWEARGVTAPVINESLAHVESFVQN